MRNMLELQKQKEQLIKKQIEHQKLLMETLAKKKNTMSAKERAEIMSAIKSLSETTKDVLSTSMSESATVKAQAQAAAASSNAAAGAGVGVGVPGGAVVAAGSPSALAAASPSAKAALMQEKERERLDRELDLLHKINDNAVAKALGGSGSEAAMAGAGKVGNGAGNVDPALVAKLESLKHQAAQMGITDPNTIPSHRGGRGGTPYMSRGRGRGGLAGRGGAPMMRSFRLDNRTTRILVRSATASLENEQEAVKAHFQAFGEIESLTFPAPNAALVQFKTRREAEVAFVKGSKSDTLGQFLMSWSADKPSSPSVSGAAATNTTSEAQPAPSSSAENNDGAGAEAPTTTEAEGELSYLYDETHAHHAWEDDDEEEEDGERSWKR
ncbi:hypothetical protein HK102_002515 [Quaeritorhiza haematococci]|nr:hypothetical protein HK102_002515 [Quaeritorhiza haematococci]